MKILPEPVVFEWDKGNINKNFIRHGVTNKETEEVFSNKPLVSEDVKHSITEKRFQALGKTDEGRLLFVSFTIRYEKVRVISARDMNKREVKMYEEV